jgi:hypothetical protein
MLLEIGLGLPTNFETVRHFRSERKLDVNAFTVG